MIKEYKKSSCSYHTTTSYIMSKTNNEKKNRIKKRVTIKRWLTIC